MIKRTTDEGAEVSTALDANGDRWIGWVLPEMTRTGRPRWRGSVEREFAGKWHVMWRSRRCRSRAAAVNAVCDVLDRIESR